MNPAMEKLAAALTKTIGANSENQEVKDWLDMGYPPLNRAISGRDDHGLPLGRIVELFGPSSSGKTWLATVAMINAQKQGGVAIFLDHERSFDAGMAEKLGLNLEFPYWIYKTPATWEESNVLMLQAAQLIRDSKVIPLSAPIIAVTDSIAACIPRSAAGKEIDEYNMNDTTALARATSTTLKNIKPRVQEFNMLALYLNQIRTKPGIMFGDPTCLRADVVVPFVDGTNATIKDIVDNKIDKEVWSFNEETKQFEPKHIVDWHNNGAMPKGEDWIFIRSEGLQTRNGAIGMSVTKDHKLMTERGWKNASEIKVGDKLLTKIKSNIGRTLQEFLEAIIAGDSSLKSMGANRKTANLTIQDNVDIDYTRWKIEKLSQFIKFNELEVDIGARKGVRFDSEFSYGFYEMLEHRRDPLHLLENLSPLKLAVWIMDDGHLSPNRDRYTVSIKRKKNDEYLDSLADMLFEKHGLRSRVRAREGSLVFDADSSRKISQLISPYVPKCMERKLLDADRGKYFEFELVTETTFKSELANVKEVRVGSSKPGTLRYDVTVADNHNYLVGNAANGVLVHNCTPGGGAMEFFADARISTGRKLIREEKNGEKELVGQEITIKVVKTKFTRPFSTCDVRLMFDEHGVPRFDMVGSAIDYLDEKKLFPKDGDYYVWDGKKLRRKAVIEAILKDGKVAEILKMTEVTKT